MKYYLLFFATIFLTLSSCFQEKEIFIPNNSPEDPAYLEKQNTTQPIRFQILVSDETVFFETKNQSVFNIPAGALLDENGATYSGQAVLEMIESNKAGDHILLGKAASIEDGMLTRSWLLKLNFSANGKPLFINPDKPIEWYTNVESGLTSMSLFTEVIAENGLKNWVKKASSPLNQWLVESNTGPVQGKGCYFVVPATGTYLIAHPIPFEQEAKIDLCISIDKIYNASNSVMYAYLPTEKILLPLTLDQGEGYYCHPIIKKEINSGIKFVLISYQDNGQHHYAEKTIEVEPGMVTKLLPEVLPFEEIVKKVRNL